MRFRPLNKVEKRLQEEKGASSSEPGIAVEPQPDCLYKAVVVRDDKRNKFYSRFDEILLPNSNQVDFRPLRMINP